MPQAQKALCDHHCFTDLFFMPTGAHIKSLYLCSGSLSFFHRLYSATIRLAINVKVYHGCDVNYILILCVHGICHLSLCTCCSYETTNSISRAPESSLLRFAQGLGLHSFIYIAMPKSSGFTQSLQGILLCRAKYMYLFYCCSTCCLLWLEATLKH